MIGIKLNLKDDKLEIKRNKTIFNKFIYFPNNDNQITPFDYAVIQLIYNKVPKVLESMKKI